MSCCVWSKGLVAGCSLAVALSTGACNRDNAAEIDRDTDRMASDTSQQAGHEGAPITLTGCLQRGEGLNNFILTQVNEPSDTPVATSGQRASGDAVQREQMRGAKHAYALEGDGDNLRDMVGKQVRVTGTLAETSDLASDAGRRDADRRDGQDLSAGDLAKVEVEGIVRVADTCGGSK